MRARNRGQEFNVTSVTKKRRNASMKKCCAPQSGSEQVPVQAIAPIEGMLEWLVDAEAASQL